MLLLILKSVGQISIATFVNAQTSLMISGWNAFGKIDDSNLSGKIALLHKFSDIHSGLVSFSLGFKSGSYTGALISSAQEAQNDDYGTKI